MCRSIDTKQKIIEFYTMLFIRALYMYSSYIYLSDLYYAGIDHYGIDIDFFKEMGALIVFILINLVYVNRNVGGVFLNFLLTSLHVLYFIPMSCTYSLNNMDGKYYILFSVYALMTEWMIGIKTDRKFLGINTGGIERGEGNGTEGTGLLDKFPVKVFCFLCCTVVIVYKLLYNGFSLNLNQDIYLNRSDYSNYLSIIEGSPLAYFVETVTNIVSYVAPIYMLVSLKQKKLVSLIISICAMMSLYSLNSEKSVLLLIPVVFIIYFCLRYNKLDKFEAIFKYGLLFVIVCSIISVILLNYRSIIYTTLIRREMYIPAWLNTLYYKFFSVNPKIMWSQDTFLLQRIIPDVFEQSPITLISDHYFNGIIPTPNTGMFADAYMQIGVLGIIIYPLIYRVMFHASQNVYSKCGCSIELLVSIKVVLALTNISVLRSNFVLSFVLMTIILYIFNFLPNIKILSMRNYEG